MQNKPRVAKQKRPHLRCKIQRLFDQLFIEGNFHITPYGRFQHQLQDLINTELY